MPTNATQPTLREQLLAAQVSVLEVEADTLEDKLRRISTGWFSNCQADMVGDIGSASSSSVYRVFHKWKWTARNTNTPFVLQMNSGDGNFINAFAAYDVIRLTQEAGNDVTVANMGMLSTHGTVVMQAAKRRVMSPRSWIVLKEAEGVARGNTNAHRDAVQFLRTQELHGWKLLVERQGSKITLDELKERTYRGAEWWLNAEEALERGLIDDISAEVQILPSSPIGREDLLPTPTDTWPVRKAKAELRKALVAVELVKLASLDGIDSLAEDGKVLLFSQVAATTCAHAGQELNQLIRSGAKAIEFLINSPGGCVVSGAGLMDVLDRCKQGGGNLTTTIYGFAASMGGFLSQTGSHRRMTRNSYFMIHQVSSIFGGSSSHMEDKQASMERLQEMLFSYMAERTGGKLSLADLKAKCNEHDWWLTATEALECGLIDEII